MGHNKDCWVGMDIAVCDCMSSSAEWQHLRDTTRTGWAFFFKLIKLAPNSAPREDYFRTQEVLNICITVQRVTYFPFLIVCIACLTDREQLTSESSIRNFHQRVTSRYAVNTNEFDTKALPGSCWFRMCVEVDRKGAEFIGDKETN